MNENEFYFDEDEAVTDSDIKTAPGWNLRMIFATEPALSIIAIEAAAYKWLWRRARIEAFHRTMDKAGKLLGEDADDPRLRDQDAWDVYNN